MNNKFSSRDSDNTSKIIQRVESLLKIKITNIAGYETNKDSLPQPIYKDESRLKTEQTRILIALALKLDDELITDEEYFEMEKAIKELFKKYIQQSKQENNIMVELIDNLGLTKQYTSLSKEEKEYFDENVEEDEKSIKIFFQELQIRRYHGYFDSMSIDEQIEFDEVLENLRNTDKQNKEIIDEVERVM